MLAVLVLYGLRVSSKPIFPHYGYFVIFCLSPGNVICESCCLLIGWHAAGPGSYSTGSIFTRRDWWCVSPSCHTYTLPHLPPDPTSVRRTRAKQPLPNSSAAAPLVFSSRHGVDSLYCDFQPSLHSASRVTPLLTYLFGNCSPFKFNNAPQPTNLHIDKPPPRTDCLKRTGCSVARIS